MCSFPDTFGLPLNIEERGIRSAFKTKKKGKNKAASARESNPGQLLGRQLYSPLYHRRVDQLSYYSVLNTIF